MKKLLMMIAFVFIGLSEICFSQTRVPPVQEAGSGTLKITPDPNRIPSNQTSKPKTKTPLSDYAITIIVDYSGSMKGAPIQAAKNSTLTLIELFEFWKQLYPDRIGNLQFQFIRFGGENEHRILYPLGPIKDFKTLKSAILRSKAKYHNTDYNSGIYLALQQLENKGIKHNKTLFLTDARDEGKGPLSGKNYDALGDTKFIIYGKGSVGKWIDTIPYSSETQAANEYEVTTAFVVSLFEYVDDINKYLVRRGEKKLDKSTGFMFSKHGEKGRYELILTRPDPHIDIAGLRDAAGNELDKKYYNLHRGKTFFQITLNAQTPPGNYEAVFSGLKRSQSFKYISFEPCAIYLKLFTTPDIPDGECFVENSVVNFDLKFWDNNQKKEVAYADFLDHVAVRYAIENGIGSYVGSELGKLRFAKDLPVGSAGKYDVLTAWNYNAGKLRNDDPPLQRVDRLCIDPNGSLVQIDFDKTQTWEGRDIKFTAFLMDPKGQILSDVKSILLNTGHAVLELAQVKEKHNKYEGLLENAKPGFYQLSIQNSGKQYRLAIDSNTPTQFHVNKRTLIFSIDGTEYGFSRENMGFWDKVFLGAKDLFSEIPTHKKVREYEGTREINIPYKLPYSGIVQRQIRIHIRPNKLFQDEALSLEFESTGDTAFSCPEVKYRWFWGLFQWTKALKEAVTAKFQLQGTVTISHGETVDQTLDLVKKDGDMDFDKPLYREPGLKTTGSIRMALANGQKRTVSLDATWATFDITTDAMSVWITKTARIGKLLLLLVIAIALLISVLLFWIIRRQKMHTRLNIWDECVNRSPEDFFEYLPEKIKETCKTDLKAGRYDDLFEDYELDLKQELLGTKRVFRKKLSEQDSRKMFNRKVAKAFAGRQALEEFRNRLKSNEVPDLSWCFSVSPATGKTVQISPRKRDENDNTEENIRVRRPNETSYGQIVVESEGRVLFRNPENNIFVETRGRGWERIGFGHETELPQNSCVKFGAGLDDIVFSAYIDFTPEQNKLEVNINREQGGL